MHKNTLLFNIILPYFASNITLQLMLKFIITPYLIIHLIIHLLFLLILPQCSIINTFPTNIHLYFFIEPFTLQIILILYLMKQQNSENQPQYELNNSQENLQNQHQQPRRTSSFVIPMQIEHIQHDSLMSLCEQVLRQKSKLKEPSVSTNYTPHQSTEINQFDPNCVQGYVENFRKCTQAQIRSYNFRNRRPIKDRQFFQFTLTSAQGTKYLIVIDGQFQPQYQINKPNTKVLLYLPQSILKGPQLMVGQHQLVAFETLPTNQKKKDKNQVQDDSGEQKKQEEKKEEKHQVKQEQKQEFEEEKKEQIKQKPIQKGNKKGGKKQSKKQGKKQSKKQSKKKQNKNKNQSQEQNNNQNNQNNQNNRIQENHRIPQIQNNPNHQQQHQNQPNHPQQIQPPKPKQIFTVLSDPHLIIEPDTIISPTFLFSWPACKRYLTLKNYIRSQYEQKEDYLFGKVAHRYMQHMINNQKLFYNMSFRNALPQIQKIYNEFLLSMYLLLKNKKVRADFQYFYEQFQQTLSKVHFFVRDHIINQQPFQSDYNEFKINSSSPMSGTETMHSSKQFAMNGKTDAFFSATMKKDKWKPQCPSENVYISFQLKPGYYKKNHSKQVDVYNMLIQQKLLKKGLNIKVIGLVLYADKSGKKYVRQIQRKNDYDSCLMERNTVVAQHEKLYADSSINLPPLKQCKQQKPSCEGCYIAQKCEVFHITKQIESPVPNKYTLKYGIHQQNNLPENEYILPDPLPDIEQIVPSNFNPQAKKKIERIGLAQLNYVKKWMKWLHEQQKKSRDQKHEQLRLKHNQFKIRASELQRIKKYYKSQPKIEPSLLIQQTENTKLRLTIQKRLHSQDQLQQLEKLYVEQRKIRLTITQIGVINKVCKIISITKLRPIAFLMEIEISSKLSFSQGYLDKAIQYDAVLDVQIETFNTQGQNTQRLNILNLTTSLKNQQLKTLIIDNYQPITMLEQSQQQDQQPQLYQTCQKIQLTQSSMKPQQQESEKLKQQHDTQKYFKEGNSEQKLAFQMIFDSQFYTLVQGMPGTGKTQLIVQVLQKCRDRKMTVLVASFTNRALDNILKRALQLKKISPAQTIRQGNQQNIDEQFLQLNSKSLNLKNIKDYQDHFKQKKFWFTTLSSVSTSQLLPKKFDLVILDEASQCLQPLCIGALIRGKKIALIGDYLQLSPIVRSEKPLLQGMSESLFQRLCRKSPFNRIQLTKQYRMNDPILKFCNTLVYDHTLGTLKDQIKTRKVQYKHPNWKQLCSNDDFVTILNPNQEVVFVNHAAITSPHFDNKKVQQLSHIIQVETACVLFHKFLQLGIKPDQITIICIYNKTVDTIKRLLKKFYPNTLNSTQVLTVDRSQGIDKQLIIFVAEMKSSTNNSLLKSHRRLNVALTRAKMKLIMIGSLIQLDKLNAFEGKFMNLLNETRQVTMSQEFTRNIMQQFNARLNSVNGSMHEQS